MTRNPLLQSTIILLTIILLSIVMLFSSVQVVHGGITAITDIHTHWAKKTINSWIEKGFAKGYKDNTFKPENTITRAEFIALINRSFGFTEKAAIQFTDATAKDWYYEDVAKAVKAGYTIGYLDGTIGANKQISREQAAVMISRLLHLEGNVMGAISSFTDVNDFPSWSIDSIGAVASAQIMTGYRAAAESYSFKPASYIKRAEAIVSLDRALTYRNSTFNEAGIYGPATGSKTVGSNVSINSSGVILQNMTISGNLIITSKVGEGNVTLKNVIVKGTTIINGGGEQGIYMENSIMNSVIVNKQAGPVRIVAKGSTLISNTIVQTSVTLEEDLTLNGQGYQTVNLAGAESGRDSAVILKGVFDLINLDGQRVQLSIPDGTVRSMIVRGEAVKNSLHMGTNVILSLLVLDAPMKFTGQGTIITAIFSTIANESSFEKQPNLRKDKNGSILPPLASPVITSVVAYNTGGNVGLGAGDTITINFDQNTNKPTITAANLNTWFLIINGHSFGTGILNQDINWNAAGNSLTIRFSNITGTTFTVGDIIRLQAAAGIMNSSSSTAASTAIGPASTGSFNSAPEILNVAAADTGNNIGLGAGDSVSITFNQATNRPTITAANLRTWVVLRNGHSFGTALLDRDISWNSIGDTLTIRFINVAGNTFVIGDTVHIKAEANIKDKQGGSSASASVSPASSGSFSSAPTITSIIAANTGNNPGLGIGDSVTITFNQITNRPAITASTINVWLRLTNGHSFGTKLSNSDIVWNSAGNALTITFRNITGTTFVIGDRVTIAKEANLRDVTNTTSVSVSSSPASTGNFSPGPAILSIVAADGGHSPGLSVNDTITITFNRDMNRINISSANLNSWFILNDGHSFGTNSIATWTSAAALTITIKSIPADPFVVGDRITISPGANLRDTTGVLVNTAVGTVASTGSFSTAPIAPKIIKVFAENTGGGVGLDAGDTLTVTFDRATNKPYINGALLSTWFSVNNSHSLGSQASLSDAYTQWDTVGKILTITFNTVSDTTFRFGDTLSVKPEANIRNDTGEIMVSTLASPPCEGTFTSAPKIVGFYVDNLSGTYDSVLGSGDTIIIVFDQLTNKPPITGVGAAQMLRSWFNIKDNSGKTLIFTNLDDNNINWMTVNGKNQLNITMKGTNPVDPVTSLELGDTNISVSSTGASAIKDITMSISAGTADAGFTLTGKY